MLLKSPFWGVDPPSVTPNQVSRRPPVWVLRPYSLHGEDFSRTRRMVPLSLIATARRHQWLHSVGERLSLFSREAGLHRAKKNKRSSMVLHPIPGL
jgi:hypothetical protein